MENERFDCVFETVLYIYLHARAHDTRQLLDFESSLNSKAVTALQKTHQCVLQCNYIKCLSTQLALMYELNARIYNYWFVKARQTNALAKIVVLLVCSANDLKCFKWGGRPCAPSNGARVHKLQ